MHATRRGEYWETYDRCTSLATAATLALLPGRMVLTEPVTIMKRKLIIAVPVALVVLLAGVVLFVIYGTGSAVVQRWIGDQLGTLASQYLNPRLSMGAVRYQYPLRAIVDDVRLLADDPARPGATIDILVVKRLTLQMAEIPRRGQPLRIQKLILDHPEIRAVSVGETDASPIGYSDLLKRQSAAQPAVKLSDVFQIRVLEVVDGLMVYDPRIPGAKPMEIDQINCSLNVQPAEGTEAGWYAIEMDLARKPVYATHFSGRVNINSMVVEVQPLRMELRVGREQDHYLPPQIQGILKEHEVSGELVVEASGSVPIHDWRAASLKAQMTLTRGNFAAGDNHLPIDRFQAVWTMADRHGALEKLDSDLLGGKLEGTGQVALDAPVNGCFGLTLTNIRLEQCFRNASGGEGKYQGAMSAQIDGHGPLDDALTQSQGIGTIHIVDGRLVQLPVLSDLLAVVGKAMKAINISSDRPTDTADLAFTFEGNRLHFNKVHALTALAALHGDGDIYFDSRLNMVFNAGPLERLESLIGTAGSILGTVTDEVMAYTLTGTLKDPKVNVKVAPNLKVPW